MVGDDADEMSIFAEVLSDGECAVKGDHSAGADFFD